MSEMDARQQLKDLCSEVVRGELEKGRLKRPRSLRNLKRWITKQVARTAGLRGDGLRRRWARAAMIALLASGIFLASGTDGKAAVSFVGAGTPPSPLYGVDAGWLSTPAFADIDGDGDMDAFVGNSDGMVMYYVNNGVGLFTEQTGSWNAGEKTGNPFHGVNVGSLSVPAFADIDGDGNLDAFIGTLDGPIKYYVNNGSGIFTEQSGAWNSATKAGNPFNGIDVGAYSAPAFADIDGDGDLDAFVGSFSGAISYYVNNGSGVFTEQTGTGNPLNEVSYSYIGKPAFADIDGDGDLDAFIGDIFGTVRYFRNSGGVFAEQGGAWNPATKAGNPFHGVDVLFWGAPAFSDIDGDGDLDAFIGEQAGKIRYYVNTGGGAFITNPLDMVDVPRYSTPAFADIDGDGDLDAFVGSDTGAISYYVNNGSEMFTEQPGTWNPATKAGNPFDGVSAGTFSAPAFADIDGDGDLDAFIGNISGALRYYVNNGSGVFTEQSGAWNSATKAGNPFNGVAVGLYSTPAFADIDGDGDLDAFIGEKEGNINYYVNNGSGVFTEQTGAWNPATKAGNPVSGVAVGYYSAPTFADIDGDGDLDAFVGNIYGTIRYYVNNDSGVFTEQTGAWVPATKAGNPFNGVDVGYSSTPAFADIDGDGDLDVFIGEKNGTIRYFKNMNNPPVSINLAGSSVNRSGGTNAVVGALSGTDPDAGDVLAFSLASGGTDNDFFNISGSTLRANDPWSMPGGNYSVLVSASDGNGGSYKRSFTVAVNDDICAYTLNRTSAAFGSEGGSGNIGVTPAGSGCIWAAKSNASWITITGNGGGIASYEVAPNWSAATRQGTMTIAGQTVTVTQAAAGCTYSLSPTASLYFSAAGGTAILDINTQNGCYWEAESSQGWTVLGLASSGTGSGSLFYSVAANTGMYRSGYITISGKIFIVRQEGMESWNCPTLTPVKFGSSYDYTIQSAYDNAASGENIKLQLGSYVEQLYLDRPINVTLTGGYDCNFGDNHYTSEIFGTLTISDGTVTLSKIILK